MNHDHPDNRRANTGAWARPLQPANAPPGGTYTGSELDYRGKKKEKPCAQPSSQQPSRC